MYRAKDGLAALSRRASPRIQVGAVVAKGPVVSALQPALRQAEIPASGAIALSTPIFIVGLEVILVAAIGVGLRLAIARIDGLLRRWRSAAEKDVVGTSRRAARLACSVLPPRPFSLLSVLITVTAL